jgi:protein-S-isoprenylcysteine O-methyltransferase Ste14
MPDLALAFLAVFGFLTLGVRVVLQLVRTGSTGLVGIGGSSRAEWASGALLATGIALAVTGPLRDDELERIGLLDGDVAQTAGIVLCAAGILIAFAAQLAMGSAWRIGVDPSERTDLVTDGPFALVRNPIYAGMLPFFVGVVLLVPNVVTVAAAAAMLASLELQTRLVEEPYLLRTHGERYARYAARVGRFVPGIGRLRSG